MFAAPLVGLEILAMYLFCATLKKNVCRTVTQANMCVAVTEKLSMIGAANMVSPTRF